MFDSKDKDLDGRLSFEEFMGEQSRAERLFKLMDKDGDGYVTKNVKKFLAIFCCTSTNLILEICILMTIRAQSAVTPW